MRTNRSYSKRSAGSRAGAFLGATAAVILCLVIAGTMLVMLLGRSSSTGTASQESVSVSVMEKFDMYMTNAVSDALDGIVAIEKVYWLSDDDMIAPMPNPDCFGETTDPYSLDWLVEEAADLLEGQELIFRPDMPIPEGSRIKYYLDETILVITWKQKINRTVFTCSEVKIRHPSQFRRFLSGGEYGSGILYTTTEMATSVNAVTASSADYYSYRKFGNLVYNGAVKRSGDRLLDTCYIDENSDLIFVRRGELMEQADIEQFVAENNIRFSLAFGPVLVRDSVPVDRNNYNIGETGDFYSRAALCQQDKLHYMVVAANTGGLDIVRFANHLVNMGVKNAYALDGGQTASIVTGNELMNDVDYGGERKISDIIYFATAVPSGG